ncbi:hypothetical protein [Brevundimonas goettingensis]|uniref:Uncharacterized protein n=1 Tax=Brevundimonas goettingensis TaxID=2774190 RepID=A0A975GXE4_9CAUL|nr:hypothetical protein [Brevundimonas goettingensis]QTC90445.1 hypothetical protein IFJ75_14330 [Brevundimonas goettingensis]
MRERLTSASSRAKARKCLKAAELSSNPEIKTEFLKLAEEFEAKARDLEGLDDATPKPDER